MIPIDGGLKHRSASAGANYEEEVLPQIEQLLLHGRIDAAQRTLEAHLKQDPRSEAAITDLATLYHAGHRTDDARRLLAAYIEVAPKSLLARKRLAIMELIAGKISDSLTAIEPVMAATPRDPEALRICGDIATALKRPDHARAFYQRTLAISPDDAETRARLDALGTAPGESAARENTPAQRQFDCFILKADGYARLREDIAAIRSVPSLRIVTLRRLSSQPPGGPLDIVAVLSSRDTSNAAAEARLQSISSRFVLQFNQPKVEQALRELQLPPLAHFTREANAEIAAPYHIAPFQRYLLHQVGLEQLRANIVGASGLRITDTPHYQYATGNRGPYLRYHEENAGLRLDEDHFPESFDWQIKNYDPAADAFSGKRSYILAVRTGPATFLILDGLHRAAILAARRAATFIVAEPIFG